MNAAPGRLLNLERQTLGMERKSPENRLRKYTLVLAAPTVASPRHLAHILPLWMLLWACWMRRGRVATSSLAGCGADEDASARRWMVSCIDGDLHLAGCTRCICPAQDVASSYYSLTRSARCILPVLRFIRYHLPFAESLGHFPSRSLCNVLQDTCCRRDSIQTAAGCGFSRLPYCIHRRWMQGARCYSSHLTPRKVRM
jgi:hypothetical protein